MIKIKKTIIMIIITISVIISWCLFLKWGKYNYKSPPPNYKKYDGLEYTFSYPQEYYQVAWEDFHLIMANAYLMANKSGLSKSQTEKIDSLFYSHNEFNFKPKATIKLNILWSAFPIYKSTTNEIKEITTLYRNQIKYQSTTINNLEYISWYLSSINWNKRLITKYKSNLLNENYKSITTKYQTDFNGKGIWFIFSEQWESFTICDTLCQEAVISSLQSK